jgi:multidrug efflux system outer membrane protein
MSLVRRRKLMLPLVTIAAVSLGACVDLAPAYRRPPTPAPAALPSGGAYPAATSSVQSVGAWRDFFGDARLKALIDLALDNNRDLRIAVANVAASRAQYVVERSNLFPKLGATLGATYGQTPTSALGGGGFSSGGGGSGVYNERLYNAKAGVSAWELDLFGKVRNSTKAALDSYFATRAARDAAQITLVGEVATDWLILGSDRALLAIAEDTRNSGEATVSLTTARFNGGVASQLDVSQAQTVVDQARYDVARLTTQVARDRNALELVVGAPVRDDLLPTDIDSDGVVLAQLPAGLTSTVLLARPDVVQAEDRLKAANANIGVARAAFFPDISLTGSGGVTSLALSTLFRASSETWSFAPTITQPIFDFGQNRGNLAYAKAQRDVSLATYEKSVQTAFREVSDALAQRGTIETQLDAQRDLTASAAKSYQLSDARYQRGADTYLNALIAQRTLYAARQTLVAARLARATNLVTLYTTLGGGLGPEAAPVP